MRVNRHDRKRMKKRMAGEAVQKSDKNIAQQAGDGIMGALRAVDDSTQAFVRDQILRLPTDGTMLQEGAFMKGPRNALGQVIFAARPGYTGDVTQYRGLHDREDLIGLGLSRSLQGGTIAAAGAGLAAMSGQFGGPADTPEPNQLPLN